MKNIYALFVAVFVCFAAHAQVYTVQPIPYAPFPYTGAGNTDLNTIDDTYSEVIPIGFPFMFYGTSYTSLVVSTNGYVTFDLSQANQYSVWNITAPVPTPELPANAAIMFPWHDTYPGVYNALFPGYIGYATYGLAPYRVFVVSFYKVPMFSCIDSTFTGQLVLQETTNAIDMYIGHKSVCESWNMGQAIQGIQNADGTEALTVPGRNAGAQWTANNEGWRFSPCAPESPTDTLSGYAFIDVNENCVFDAGDQPLEHEMVIADDCVIAYTDVNGYYEMVLDEGTHTITHVAPGYAANACPASQSYTLTFSAPFESLSGYDFADTLLPVACADVSVAMGIPYLRWCGISIGSVQYTNNSAQATQPLILNVTVPDSVFVVGGTFPAASQNGNTYTFNVPYVQGGGTGFFHFIDSVSCDATVGTVKCIAASVSGYPDCDTTNNSWTDCQEVVSSFDPNEMLVASQNFEERGFVTGETIQAGDSLLFHINFQNTGTAPAYDIVVIDTLPYTADAASVVTGISSHPYTFTNEDGVLTWNFFNIMLPDSGANEPESHGFVRFSVQQNPTNTPGTVIANRAAIYFDQNAPVITNYAMDTLAVFTGILPTMQNELSVYPNPAVNELFVRYNGDGANATLKVYNALGQIETSIPLHQGVTRISTDGWAKGIYSLQLLSNKSMLASKVVLVD